MQASHVDSYVDFAGKLRVKKVLRVWRKPVYISTQRLHCLVYTYIHTYTRMYLYSQSRLLHVHAFAAKVGASNDHDARRTCVYVYVCMYVRACMYTCMYVCMYVGMYVYMYACVYVCVCVMQLQ